MAFNLTIWIDADSCPVKVRNHVLSYSASKEIPVAFVANHDIPIVQNPLFKMIVVPKEEGSADNYIFENSKENDFVITRDIPFAARLIEKNIPVINDRGTCFTKDNIADKLSERDFNLNLAMLGFGNDKKSNYSEKDFKKFADCFDREITKNLMAETYGCKRQ